MKSENELIGAYPSGWIWRYEDFDLMKCLIPFFDGLAIFMPGDLAQGVIDSDPYLAQPLFNLNYLRNIDPDVVLDEDLSNRILEMVRRFVRDNRFRVVGSERQPPTYHHFGGRADPSQVLEFISELENMGLAGAIGKDGTFAAQSSVCAAIIESCFLALSLKLRPSGIDLVPVTFSPWTAFPYDPTVRHYSEHFTRIFMRDVQEVGVDLRAVPLDEVMEFSAQYRPQYKAYLRDVREVARAIEQANDYAERNRIEKDRLESIRDQAAFLHRVSRSEFRRRSLALTVGIASSGWTLLTGDPVAAALAVASTAVGLLPSPEAPSSYTYLFEIARR